MQLIATIVLLAVTAYAQEEEKEKEYTLAYSPDNFDEEVAKAHHFVMFHAPWCGHCKRLHPTWEELAEMLNTEGSHIKIAKVDCTAHGNLCNDHDVTGYPTLKFFKVGDGEGVKFKGTRDLPSMTAFIYEQTNTTPGSEKVKIPEAAGLTELTEDTFEKFVASGNHFVKFYAPWCGHCQKLAPVWDQLSRTVEHSNEVKVSKIDCTQYRGTCSTFDIKGYPTLLWIEDGKKVEKYQGERNLPALTAYIEKMIGSSVDTKEESKDTDEADDNVMILTGDSFDHGIEKGVTFIKFFAPWCGHCKRLAPVWDELGKKFIGHPEVSVVKIDCTLDDNKELCTKEQVEGFPTLYLYKNGQRISEYDGNRSLQSLFDFVKQHVSSHDEL